MTTQPIGDTDPDSWEEIYYLPNMTGSCHQLFEGKMRPKKKDPIGFVLIPKT